MGKTEGHNVNYSDQRLPQIGTGMLNAQSSLSEAKICLHVCGITGSGSRGVEVLDLLRKLEPRLQALRDTFPNLGNTIEMMLSVAKIRRGRARTLEIAPKYEHVRYGVVNIVRWLIHDQNSPLCELPETEYETSLLFDVVALRWLQSTVMRCFGDQITERYWANGDTPQSNFEELKLAIRKAASPNEIKDEEKGNYAVWIPIIEAKREVENDYDSNRTHTLAKTVARIRTIKEITVVQQKPRKIKEIPRLTERQLCFSNWYFPRPREIAKLKKFLEPVRLHSSASSGRYEEVLISLSIISCRPIQTILKWPVDDDISKNIGKNRFVIIQEISGNDKVFTHGVFWIKAEDGISGTVARVGIRHLGGYFLALWQPQMTRQTLQQILPFSTVSWDRRAYAVLAAELGCTPQRAELITRDFLPIILYKDTCNTAQVNYFRSDSAIQKNQAERVALSHYLQPTGNRASATLDKAIFNSIRISPDDSSSIDVKIGTKPLTQNESNIIFDALTKNTDQAKDAIERHNALALKALYINILATGHRSSRTPFPFPWDFSPSEKLVFICDKKVTGSEARFLPLTPSATRLTAEYAAHLKHIATRETIDTKTKDYVQQTYHLLGFENERFITTRKHDFIPYAGVFFLLLSDGSLVTKPISTRFLDLFIKEKTGIQRVVRRVRATMADYLWRNGHSGRGIQAFLGHQPEMHVHGPSSTWSVLSLASSLSRSIESYFTEVLGLPKCTDRIWLPTQYLPSLDASPHDPEKKVHAPGYEGRERENVWAEQRAQSIIRRELSEYFIASMAISNNETTDQDRQFTETDRKRLEERIRSELENDHVALKKVNSALQGQLSRLKLSSRRTENTDLQLSAPGPIDINFSRLLRWALGLRHIWEQNVGKPIGSPSYDPLERLAQLAISLVCFDGVLAEENLEGLVMAAACGESESDGSRITLRCRVVTNTHDYEFCAQVGEVSAALVLGCLSQFKTFFPTWIDIQSRMCAILDKLVRVDPRRKWTVTRFCTVFRPYWLIRMSGAMYSVAIGEHKGPAPDARSNAQLHGINLPSEINSSFVGKILPKSPKSDQDLAISALKKIFSNARGFFERGEQRKLPQRSRLQNGLSSKEANDALHHGRNTQIVGLLLSFIGKLLDKGGPLKSQLALSSIDSYFSSIVTEFIYQAWEFDFDSASSDALSELFNSVSEKVHSKNRNLALRLFSHHLRDEISIPHFDSQWFSPREPVRIRASLVLPSHLTQAISALNRKRDPTARHAATFLAISHSYGLRKAETFGLSKDCFDTSNPSHLTVGRTPIADLKTRSGRRVIAAGISTLSTGDHILKAVKLARTSGRPKGFIFESSTTDNKIELVGPITFLATEAIRHATGNAAAVPYSLRHSFATILGLALYAYQSKFPNNLDALSAFRVGKGWGRIPEILNSPSGWPFGVDAIATALGHVDCSTFLNVYFHGSHLLINSHCQSWQPEYCTQEQIARMLNKERSSLSKLTKKLRRCKNSPKGLKLLPKLVELACPRFVGVYDTAQAADLQSAEPRRWELFLRALQLRQEQDLTLDAMKLYAIDGLGMSQDTVETMADAYLRLVSETVMDDFEPASSHLVNPTVSHQVGISRGANEREDFVARTQAWANSSRANATVLRNLLENWHTRVKSSKPVIVCQSSADFDVTIATLTDLGANPQQLDIRLHGDIQEPWRDTVLAEYPNSTFSSVRASRGSTKVKVTEVSITVRQTVGSLIPDGRDLHRAMLGLYIGLHALGMDD